MTRNLKKSFRFTATEYAQIESKASELGMTVAGYIRYCALRFGIAVNVRANHPTDADRKYARKDRELTNV